MSPAPLGMSAAVLCRRLSSTTRRCAAWPGPRRSWTPRHGEPPSTWPEVTSEASWPRPRKAWTALEARRWRRVGLLAGRGLRAPEPPSATCGDAFAGRGVAHMGPRTGRLGDKGDPDRSVPAPWATRSPLLARRRSLSPFRVPRDAGRPPRRSRREGTSSTLGGKWNTPRRRCCGTAVKPVAPAGTTVVHPGRKSSRSWVWPAWCTATGGPVLPR